MNSSLKTAITPLVFLILSACATVSPEPESALVHFYDYQWSLPAEPTQVIATEQVAEQLKGFDVVFFGELHNHPGIHLAQMELFAELYRLNPNISLSLEQFERDEQAMLDQYLAGEIGEEYLIEQTRAWRNYRSSYRPLVEFARERGSPVIAANAPKQMVVCVGRSGLEVLDKFSDEERQHVARDVDVTEGAYWRKFSGVMHGSSAHGTSADSESLKLMQSMRRRSFAAQALRDDTMAESIARHLQQLPGRQVLHLNGNFHSSAFLGTVERLQRRMPALKIAVIHSMTEKEAVTEASAQPSGTVLLKVRPVPDKFVQAEHRDEWFRKVMKKRMEGRKKCPD